MHISKKLGIAAAIKTLLSYAFVYRYYTGFGIKTPGGIPHYGMEEMSAHITTLLVGLVVFLVLQGGLKQVCNAKQRKLALIAVGIACAFQLFPLLDFSKEANSAGIGFYLQLLAVVDAAIAAWLAKTPA